MKRRTIFTAVFFVVFYAVRVAKSIRFDEKFEKAIVHGFTKPIEPNQAEVPYQATLAAQLNDTLVIFCGGSLIHPRWILTAAHCLEQDGQQLPTSLIKISVGSVLSDFKRAQILDVEKTLIHNSYLVSTGVYDIGVIKTRQPAKLSKSVKLVKLFTDSKEQLEGKTAYLTGFGVTNDFFKKPKRLRKAILHINAPEKCSIDPIDEATLLCCTSTIAEGKACKGDSGGPLVIKKNGKVYQVGVTSHLAILPLCKLTFNHSVYTKVASYISWISSVTGIDFLKYNNY